MAVFQNGNNQAAGDESLIDWQGEFRSVIEAEKTIFYAGDFFLPAEDSFIVFVRKIAFRFIARLLKTIEKFFGLKFYFGLEPFEIAPKEDGLLKRLAAGGIVKKIGRGIGGGIYPDEPRFFHYSIELGNVLFYSDAPKQICHFASGSSFGSRRKAFMRAIGEAVERFCLDCYQDDDLVSASYKELKEKAVNPSSFVSFSSSQREKSGLLINEDSVFRWVKGYSLLTGKARFIPAQMIFVSYKPVNKEEPLIQVPISTGAAAGLSLEKAICVGLRELVERDAFMINYLNKISPPRLDLNGIKNKEIKNLIDALRRYRLEFHLLDITSDISVPAVLAVIIDKSGVGPPISIGTCASLNILEAIEGAIMEAVKIRISCRKLFEKNNPAIKIKPEDIINFDNRKLFWRDPNLIKRLDFWFRGPVRKLRDEEVENFDDVGDELEKILTAFKNAGIEPFMVDITIPPARKVGFFVVKTVAPGIQPLYLNENLRYLGGERLYQVPVKMGWRDKPFKEEELNSLPHPFI